MDSEFPLNPNLQDSAGDVDSEELLNQFLQYVENQQISLYPEQEEAILSLFAGHNVILCTPTGSGKSLVATALHFLSLARGRRSYYTCPIKALVNEKFLSLCRIFGPENVGMSTGDATVNGEAPIICCTAEILSNIVLREGESANVHDVIMDEFHYYADRERGVSWQVPLLVLNYSRFLLMSATLGDPRFFKKALTERTALETTVVETETRPVPLDFLYSVKSLTERLRQLLQSGQSPIYLVCFTQREVADHAQGLLSINVCSKEEKSAIANELKGVRFNSSYGKEVKKLLSHGIGIHHAGLLPKYRLLVERLSQQGLLKIICGTDTLGVGINVPIRTVLFTKLCKYDGEKTRILPIRDFHQIAGRAGRKGFDERGTVVAQAPEHVIENIELERKAEADPKKKKKFKKKQPPQKGYVHWDENTFESLKNSISDPLRSSFQVNYSLLLNVLSRHQDGCSAMKTLVADCHETVATKKKLRRQSFKLLRSLLERGIVEFAADGVEGRKKIKVNVELQDDFSIFQELAIWLLDTIPLLDCDSPEFQMDLLTLIESICENPRVVLLKQFDKVKGEKIRELKEQGVDYDERMLQIEDLTYPKPNADFIYQTYNQFQLAHPWMETDNIKPKSIARDMFEQYMSFDEYIREYGLQRSEGILLRYLSQVYKVMTQTIPESLRNDDFEEVRTFFKMVIGQVDTSLIEEWERIKDPEHKSESPDVATDEMDFKDITRNKRGFAVVVRNTVFQLLRSLARRDYSAVGDLLELESAKLWNEKQLRSTMEEFYLEHQAISTDARARYPQFHKVVRENEVWQIEQTITDPQEKDDWLIKLSVDLTQSKEKQQAVLVLHSIAAVGDWS